jgi:predicted metalloenzyme YecM
MKQRYSTEDLANIVRQTINLQYNNPQKILDDFKTNIKGKVKSLHTKELTDNEIETNSLKVANDIFGELDRISLKIISAKLSNELVDASRIEGIELEEYKEYFVKFAKEIVKQILQAKFNYIKKQIRQVNSKTKKKR